MAPNVTILGNENKKTKKDERPPTINTPNTNPHYYNDDDSDASSDNSDEDETNDEHVITPSDEIIYLPADNYTWNVYDSLQSLPSSPNVATSDLYPPNIKLKQVYGTSYTYYVSGVPWFDTSVSLFHGDVGTLDKIRYLYTDRAGYYIYEELGPKLIFFIVQVELAIGEYVNTKRDLAAALHEKQQRSINKNQHGDNLIGKNIQKDDDTILPPPKRLQSLVAPPSTSSSRQAAIVDVISTNQLHQQQQNRTSELRPTTSSGGADNALQIRINTLNERLNRLNSSLTPASASFVQYGLKRSPIVQPYGGLSLVNNYFRFKPFSINRTPLQTNLLWPEYKPMSLPLNTFLKLKMYSPMYGMLFNENNFRCSKSFETCIGGACLIHGKFSRVDSEPGVIRMDEATGRYRVVSRHFNDGLLQIFSDFLQVYFGDAEEDWTKCLALFGVKVGDSVRQIQQKFSCMCSNATNLRARFPEKNWIESPHKLKCRLCVSTIWVENDENKF